MIDRFSQARVLCVGDIMLDRYVRGRVDRISPEAPVPVLRVESEDSVLGGVGNVAANVSGLGATAHCLGLVGNDHPATELAGLLADIDRCHTHLIASDSASTTVKTRCIGGHQQMVRIDRDPERAVEADVLERLIEKAHALMGQCDVLVLSDYGKGVLTPDVTRRLIAFAAEQGIPVVVDPKGPRYHPYSGATLVTPNLKELAAATRESVDNPDAIVAAARSLKSSFQFAAVLVTMSDKGMMLLDVEDSITWVDTTAQAVFDVSGAGDTVVAVMSCGLAINEPLDTVTTLANRAAGMVVAKLGTAVVTREEIAQADLVGSQSALVRKLVDVESLTSRVARWRAEGLKVGFTNGCFDLIHPGHVALLASARQRCDRLVVALNSDESVRGLKGETRPVQTEAARAAVLASMSDVDALVVFGEETPRALIEQVRPEVLIKGADYTLDEVVGGDFVASYGGRVELVPLVEGQSTTSLLSRRSGG